LSVCDSKGISKFEDGGAGDEMNTTVAIR